MDIFEIKEVYLYLFIVHTPYGMGRIMIVVLGGSKGEEVSQPC